MFNINYKYRYWKYLLVCACGMTLGLAGWNPGYLLALAAAALQFYASFLERGHLMSFQVQVHMTYLVVLLMLLKFLRIEFTNR